MEKFRLILSLLPTKLLLLLLIHARLLLLLLLLLLSFLFSSSIFAEQNLQQIKQTTKTKNKMTVITHSAHK
jgi:hypothetical protein